MIAEGRNTNVTLIFSLDRYREVIDAYLDGLEAYAAQDGTELGTVASVASFFISRVDTEVDRRLEQIGSSGGAGAARQGGDRPGQARLPSVRRDVQRRALGGAGRPRRQGAASAVGEHVDEEPRLPGHDVRRQPDRTVHRQHDARCDDRGVPRPRHARAHRRPGRRRGARPCGTRSPTSASTSTTSPPNSNARAWPVPEELPEPDRGARRQGRRAPRRAVAIGSKIEVDARIGLFASRDTLCTERVGTPFPTPHDLCTIRSPGARAMGETTRR